MSEYILPLTYFEDEFPTFPRWRSMETAPTDGTIVNVMGRCLTATAGFPRYAGFYNGEWCEFGRHDPIPLVCWAWRPRDPSWEWPREGGAA